MSLLPDSMGRSIYALVDGSFLLGKDGGEELRGEAYLIENDGDPAHLRLRLRELGVDAD